MVAGAGDSGRTWLAMVCAWATTVVLASIAMPARAQQLELTFQDGRVTLHAQGVSARQVLEEWARKGRTTVVNAERLSSRPISLVLDSVPETQALGRILESTAGYVARRRTGTVGPSDIGLIMVLATSEAAAHTPIADPAFASPDDTDEPPVVAGEPSSAVGSPDAEPEPNAPSAEPNGRSPDARPDARQAGERDPATEIPAEKLPAGRPEGARPGVPVISTPASPLVAPAPAPVEPGTTPATDANGRPPRKPPA
jgi:hypothetical protein